MSKRRQLWLLFRAHVLRDLRSLHDIAAHYASAHENGLLPRSYYDKAFRYYKQGAERGNPACQYDYGFFLVRGDVVDKDEKLGLSWIKKAAEAGYLAAKDFLADYPVNWG